jgi:hypothetical protein
MKIYIVVHRHEYGITVNPFKSLDSAEQCAWVLKTESAKEFGINIDECLDSDDECALETKLLERGEEITIETGELQ